MSDDRIRRAHAILAAIGTGALPTDAFTDDARWWWNGGIDLPLAEFRPMLARVHDETIGGVQVTPGLVMVDADTVMVEATSHAPLRKGGVYANRYVFLFAFAGERVRQVREYSDSAHVLATFDLG